MTSVQAILFDLIARSGAIRHCRRWAHSAHRVRFSLAAAAVRPARLILVTILLLPCWMPLAGCTLWPGHDKPQINAPLRSPYPGPKVWGVAPLANESGTSAVDPLHIADLVTQEVQQADRIDTIPVQRVLEAMRAMNLGQITSPGQAQQLARILDLDGLIVGTITAYDPYNPPTLGLTLQLYTLTDPGMGAGFDPVRLGASPTDRQLDELRQFRQPVASASAIRAAAENAVLRDLESFARGRTTADTALGWERYLVSMDLYTRYVSHGLIASLFRQERLRLAHRPDQQYPPDL